MEHGVTGAVRANSFGVWMAKGFTCLTSIPKPHLPTDPINALLLARRQLGEVDELQMRMVQKRAPLHCVPR